MFLPGDLIAPLLVIPRPPGPGRRLGGQKAGVSIAVAPYGALIVVHFQDGVGDAFQERPIVRGHDDRAPMTAQMSFEPGHGLVVQIVGRLVEQ